MTDLAQRYGAPSPLLRPLVVVGVVLLAAVGLGWVLWAGLLQSRPDVQSQLSSFAVHGEHRADARFTVVRRDREIRASCLLRAYAADHSVVGELSVPVGPSSPASTSLTRNVRTERRATSIELVGCTTKEQHRPR